MKRYLNEQGEEVQLPANWNQQIDPRSQAVEATDDIESLMLAGGLAKAGLSSGLPRLGKMLGVAERTVEGQAPALVANEIGAVGKEVRPVVKRFAELTPEEATAKALADKAFQPQVADDAYRITKEGLMKQQAANRAADFAERARLQKLMRR